MMKEQGREFQRGVSVVVCSHNGADRLPGTLAHLASQRVTRDLLWEVIVVDNASTDDTAGIARRHWVHEGSGSFRIVSEPRLGLNYARCRGFEVAKYAVVSFVDDDNWVSRDWVSLVADIMAGDSGIGACGGAAEAKCEIPPPWWFDQYQSCYAVGPQSDQPGDVTWTKGYLWGAGLTVRKSAWQHLRQLGFHFLLTDRKGSELLSGGDMELCYALRLAGWTLWYDPRLSMHHYIPCSRLSWRYLRKMHRGFGVASATHKAYFVERDHPGGGIQARLRGTWWCQAGVCAIRIMGQVFRFLLTPSMREGHPAVLELESLVGTFIELGRRRALYDVTFRNTQALFPNGSPNPASKAA